MMTVETMTILKTRYHTLRTAGFHMHLADLGLRLKRRAPLMGLFLSLLVWVLFGSFHLFAQVLEGNSPNAPSLFKSEKSLNDYPNLKEALQSDSSLQFNDQGGLGKISTISLRGASSSDLAVTLEGIRLNSATEGYFNWGELNIFGLDRARILRGGYVPYHSSPAGQVELFLPTDGRSLVEVSGGSFDHRSLGILVPSASFFMEQADQDYLYKDSAGNYVRRHNNSHFQVQTRAWKKTENYQVWGQFLASNQELPGPASLPQTGDALDTQSALVAYQQNYRGFRSSVWLNVQNQDSTSFGSTTLNKTLYSGARVERAWNHVESFSTTHILETNADALNNSEFGSEFRSTLAYSLMGFWMPYPGQLIHPRARVEFVSDLDRHFSEHPGIGGRHATIKNLDLLWNFAWISRTPTFYELYFRGAGFESNPNLKRQQSMQGDFGYEYRLPSLNAQASQAAFFNRTSKLIQTEVLSPTTSRSANFGKSLTWGIENNLNARPIRWLANELSYTYQQSQLDDVDRQYQPRHRLRVRPTLFSEENIQLALPIYFRSAVRTPSFYSPPRVKPQWDVGAELTARHEAWQIKLSAFNLLRWDREEIKDYPLPQETWIRLSLEYRFGRI